jgi:iron complex transport system permease protein
VIVAPARLRAGPLVVACAGLAGAALLAVLVGPVRLDPGAVLAELAGRLPLVHTTSGLSRQEAAILWELRLPRVVLGGLVGAMLALAGVAYQGVFRNPLADPYLLGAAAGAGLGATLAIAYGPDTSGWPTAPDPAGPSGALRASPAGPSICCRWPRSSGRSAGWRPPMPWGARAGPGPPPP